MADVNKEIALKVTTDTTQTQSALKGAEERLNEAKKRMVELAVAGKQNTEEFRKLAVEAGTLKGRLELVEQTVDGIGKSANKIEVFSGAVQGIAASFALAQGAAALFAEGDEELQKAFVKTQAALAILAGTEQAVQLLRKESAAGQALLTLRTKAYTLATNVATATTKSFGIALAATGIGLAVVALGFLIQKFMETKAATKAANDELEIAKQRQEALTASIARTIKARELDIRIMQILGATDKQIAVERISDIGRQLEAATAAVKQEQDQLERFGDFFTEKVKIRRQQVLEEKQFAVKTLEAQLLEQLAIIKKYDAEEDVYRAERNLAAQELSRAKVRNADATAQEILKAQKKALDEELDAIFNANNEGWAKQQEVIKARYELDKFYSDLRIADEKAVQDAKYQIATSALASLSTIFAQESQSRIDESNERISQIQNESNKRLEVLKAAGASELQLSAELSNQKSLIDQELTSSAVKQAERAFKFSKALAIVQTTIDTIQAAQGAYKAMVGIPVAGPFLAVAAAGSATLAGLARINQIRKQQFNSPSSPTSVNTGAPSLGGRNVGDTNVPAGFDSQTTNLGNFGQPTQSGGGSNGMGRVVVVERDIREVRNRVDSVERFATFG